VTEGGGGREEGGKATHLPTYFHVPFFFWGGWVGGVFYGVFELLMQRNGQKRDKKIEGKNIEGKSFFSPQPFCKKLSTWTFPKILWCF
jgi:hypothetical protein